MRETQGTLRKKTCGHSRRGQSRVLGDGGYSMKIDLWCLRTWLIPSLLSAMGCNRLGGYPFEDMEVDFTEVKPSKVYKYLLVLVYTYSGWAEALPTRMERAREIKWKLHRPYRPQRSGKVECMNRTLTVTLAKLCQETQASWVDMLPLGLLRSRCTVGPACYPLKSYSGGPSVWLTK
ncbi:Gag-Pol polyprotein [Plecturocebus cupreus]